jgi:hypothetical protein
MVEPLTIVSEQNLLRDGDNSSVHMGDQPGTIGLAWNGKLPGT